jgi:hypothetical protein
VASYKDEQLYGALQDHLQAGERVQHTAYGLWTIPVGRYWYLMLLGPLAWLGLLVWWAATVKRYVIALTDRRLLVVHVDGRLLTKALWDYPRAARAQLEVRTRERSRSTDVDVAGPPPFQARFQDGPAASDGKRAAQIARAWRDGTDATA